MEFETNTSSTDEAARFQATTKRVTLEPVSTSVVPEPATGADLNVKMSETATQPNISSDSEDTGSQRGNINNTPITTPQDPEHPKGHVVIGSTVIACLFVAAFIWMSTQ